MDQISTTILSGTGLEPSAFIILCAVSFLASLLTAMMGLGGGMLMLAAMALYLPPQVLIPLHGAVQLGSNTGRAVLMMRDVMRHLVPAFVLGSVLGALIGGQVVVALPVFWLKIILALFILYSVWVPKFQARKPGRKVFFLVALASTFATMFVGATGPLIAPFAAAASKRRQQMVATHAALMTIQHLLKLVVFGFLGFAFQAWLPVLAGLLGFGFAGTLVGRKLLNRLPEAVFRRGLRVVLTVISLRLLWDAVWKISG